MANFYSDSHGERWGVIMQEKKTSCGPACVAMAQIYIKSQAIGDMQGKALQLSQKYPGKWTESGGERMPNMVAVLRAEGIHCYDPVNCGGGGIWSYLYAYAKDTSPAIVGIAWRGGGAHVALCVSVYKSDQHCIFLDPFYGLVELPGSTLPYYAPGDPTGAFPPVAIGNLDGWAIFTKPNT